MVFPILGANTESAAYEISNSLRLNDDDSPYLSDTPGSAGNRRTFTISLWAKRSDLNTSAVLYGAGTAATDMFQLLMHRLTNQFLQHQQKHQHLQQEMTQKKSQQLHMCRVKFHRLTLEFLE